MLKNIIEMIISIENIIQIIISMGLLFFAGIAYRAYITQCRLSRYTHVYNIRQEWNTIITQKNGDRIKEFIRYTCHEIMHTKDDILSDLLTTALASAMYDFYIKNENSFKDFSEQYTEVTEYFNTFEELGNTYNSWKVMNKEYNRQKESENKKKIRSTNKSH